MADNTDLESRIRNRRSWLQVVLVSGFAAIVGWKLLTGSVPAQSIDVATLLSVLLSLFAIALSVAFYFKATETSNTFYDNTYRFTKEISEILGRIEAGFGERLRQLDEGYSGLRESVSGMPRDPAATQQALHHEEETIKKLEAEKAAVLSQLAERAELQEAEKKTLFDQMEVKDRELRQVRAEAASLRRKLIADVAPPSHDSPDVPRHANDETLRRVSHYTRHFATTLLTASTKAPEGALRESFAELREALPPGYIRDLQALGFVSTEGHLTGHGVRWLRRLAREPAVDDHGTVG
jgi:hypothetical protein